MLTYLCEHLGIVGKTQTALYLRALSSPVSLSVARWCESLQKQVVVAMCSCECMQELLLTENLLTVSTTLFLVFSWYWIVCTTNNDNVKYCQEYFGFALPSALWVKRVSKFELSFKCFLSALWLFFVLIWFVFVSWFVLFIVLPCLLGE